MALACALAAHTGRRSGPAPVTVSLGFRLALFAVTWLSPLLALRPPPLGLWSLPVRTRALERLERTPLSLALLAVKAMLSIPYYEHPDVAAEIGFDGACLGEEGR